MNEEMICEQEINLADIFVRVLCEWKKAVIFSVIGAVLMAGYVLLTTMNPKPEPLMNATQLAEAEARLQEIENLLTANEEKIEKEKMAIEDLEVLIEINEMNITNSESEIKRLEKSNEELRALEKIYQIAVDATLEANIVDEDFTSDVMGLTLRIADAQHAVYDNESRIEALNIEIVGYENEIEETLPKEIKKIEKQIKELEKDAKELEEEADEWEAKKEETFTPEFSFVKVVVFSALGAVVGLMGLCGYVVVIMLSNNKIYNAQVLESNFGLHILGTVSEGTTAKKKNFLDKWIEKLNGINQNVSADSEAEIIATKIKTLSKTGKVMAIGTVDVENIQHLVKIINNAGGDTGIEIIAAGNPMYSTDTLNKLNEYELVVVEIVNDTNSKELAKLMRFINKSEAKVLGTIVEYN